MNNVFGVPCSQLKEVALKADIPCTNEEEAFALAYGVYLSGKKAVVYMQDTGLFKCANILLGLYKCTGVFYPQIYLSARTKPNYHKVVSEKIFAFMNLIDYCTSVKLVRQLDE
jgi:sulfopyruvate decarboxylase TPP-binding subunit